MIEIETLFNSELNEKSREKTAGYQIYKITMMHWKLRSAGLQSSWGTLRVKNRGFGIKTLTPWMNLESRSPNCRQKISKWFVVHTAWVSVVCISCLLNILKKPTRQGLLTSNPKGGSTLSVCPLRLPVRRRSRFITWSVSQLRLKYVFSKSYFATRESAQSIQKRIRNARHTLSHVSVLYRALFPPFCKALSAASPPPVIMYIWDEDISDWFLCEIAGRTTPIINP